MRLTDKEFFENHINLELPELAAVKSFCDNGDFGECRRVFAEYVRSVTNPELFFETRVDGGVVADTPELREKAENACRHYMVSCSIPHDFGREKVDWEFNPTYNAYVEWPWQLNRHYEFTALAECYLATGDAKYAAACAELFESWQMQMNAPTDESPYRTVGWRTIECGIRQGLIWPFAFHAFCREFSDDTVVNWCKSVCEHGIRLENDYTSNNWLIMEMNGLIHIAVLNPWLKASPGWKELALTLLEREADAQIYPDGVQTEISTDYQAVIIRNYTRVIRLCKAYGISISQHMRDMIEKAIMMYVHLMMPDGRTPAINDGTLAVVRDIVGAEMDVYGENEIFRAVMNGEEPPLGKNCVFEYPGIATLRSGWGKDDVYVHFDGGEFGSGHQHEDKLSFVMYANGKQIVCEGNNYAYDDSDMRKYVLSTHSHNTVIVDGMGQNRRRDYKWSEEMISKKSKLRFNLSEDADFLSAVYDEGYGEDCDISVVHKRNLYFVKNVDGVKPFVICVDRMYSESEHSYGVLWHLDSETFEEYPYGVGVDGMRMSVSDSGAVMSVCRGQTEPSVQGWTANTAVQGDYRPVYCLTHTLTASSVRHISVLSPVGEDGMCVVGVEGGEDVCEQKIRMTLADGRQIDFEEF